MEPKPGSMGKPSAGYVIDILDEMAILAKSVRKAR